MTAGTVVLVETYADRAAGHFGDNLVRLARGARHLGREVIVIAVQGVHPQLRAELEPLGLVIVNRPTGTAASLSLWCGRKMLRVHSALVRFAPHGGLQAQALYLSRCAAEVAALRTARFAGPAGSSVMLLTGSEALIATAATFSGADHVRFVHDVGPPEGWIARMVDRLCRRGEHRVVAVCTTPSVEQRLLARNPGLRTVARTFTVADAGMYLSPDERAPARASLGIAPDEYVVVMIGGWWPYKDVDMVRDALERVHHPVTVILAGNPMTPSVLESASAASGGRIVNRQGSVTEAELRSLYAASDVALVTRVAGYDGEASTVIDAVRYGVPLVVTDHHPRQSELLADEAWVRMVPPGDGAALARAFDELFDHPLPRPDPEAPGRLGVSTAEEVVSAAEDLSRGA